MASSIDEAQDAILKAIKSLAEQTPVASIPTSGIRNLAEAWAWLEAPRQPHGGHVSAK